MKWKCGLFQEGFTRLMTCCCTKTRGAESSRMKGSLNMEKGALILTGRWGLTFKSGWSNKSDLLLSKCLYILNWFQVSVMNILR